MTQAGSAVGHAKGAILMGIFSAVWFLWGTALAPVRSVHLLLWPLMVLSVAAVLFGWRTLVIVQSRWPAAASGNPFRLRAYRLAVTFEVIGVPAAFGLLGGRPGTAIYLPTAVAVIVGLHFVGVVVAFRSRLYIWVAIAMCACGLAALAVPASAPARIALVGLGCGFVLWVTAVARLLLLRRNVRRPSSVRAST